MGRAAIFVFAHLNKLKFNCPISKNIICCSVLQGVAVCCIVCVKSCSVLQCVAVCCSVLQCVAVCCSVLHCVAVLVLKITLYCSVLRCVAVCCSVVQFVFKKGCQSCSSVLFCNSQDWIECCSVLKCVRVWCSVLQFVAARSVCYSVVQCVSWSGLPILPWVIFFGYLIRTAK